MRVVEEARELCESKEGRNWKAGRARVMISGLKQVGDPTVPSDVI
jgi:hypothetical protein